MTKLLTIFISLTILTAHAQKVDIGLIKHKKEKYFLTKTCYDFLEWDEIILTDKSIENRINSAIRKRVSSYKLGKDDIDLFCKKEMDYTFMFEILYLKNNIISISLSKSIYIKDTPHPWTEFQTMNFNSETGMELNFSSLFDSTKLSSLDSLIVNKATRERQFSGMDSLNLEQSIYPKKFNISNDGIIIIYIYQNYPMDVLLTYEEIRPFMLRQGPLKEIYGTAK